MFALGNKFRLSALFYTRLLFIALVTNFLAPLATAQQQMPPIQVVGTRTDGRQVLCRGDACAYVIAALTREITGLLQQSNNPGDQNEVFLTKDQICTAVKKTKPSGCGDKPSVTGLDGVTGNGCGTGWASRATAWATLASQHGLNFTGNVDAPARGASFLGSCNQHDACYGTQAASQQSCDQSFRGSMSAACSSAADPTVCGQMASLYHGTVVALGTNAYDASALALGCYTYHKNLEDNSCPK